MGKVISISRYLEKKSEPFTILPDVLFEKIEKGAIAEICTAPPGKYRVVKEHAGKPDHCSVVDDYDSRFKALWCAREFTRKAKMRLSPLRFSAYDANGSYLGGRA